MVYKLLDILSYRLHLVIYLITCKPLNLDILEIILSHNRNRIKFESLFIGVSKIRAY